MIDRYTMTEEEIVDEHYKRLYAFAWSLAKNDHDAADLVQSTFLQWMRKRDTIRKQSALKSWLFTSLYRDFLNRNKKSKRSISVEKIPEMEDLTSTQAARVTDQHQALELLKSLREDYRAPMTLFYLEGFAYKEISEILGIELGTVMSRLHRGRELLRTQMNQKPIP